MFLYFFEQPFHFIPPEEFTNNDLKIYFINMDEQIDRWDKIKDKLQNIHRFNAINGKKVNRDELIRKGILTEKNMLGDGQLGCALSHIECIKLIKDQDEEFGLILEDDVIIPDDFDSQIKKIKKYLPKKWDIIFLGGCNIYGKKINEKFISPTQTDGSKNLCMHAYIINKNNSEKILSYLKPLYRPVDSQLRDNFNELDIFYANPNLINQNKNLISNRRVLDGLPQSDYWKKHHTDITITH